MNLAKKKSSELFDMYNKIDVFLKFLDKEYKDSAKAVETEDEK